MKSTPENGGIKRDSIFRFRVTPHEREIIKNLAKENKVSVSRYLRSILESKPIMTNDRELLIRLQAELGKEGSNLNQIAHVFNLRMKSGEPIDVCPNKLAYTLECITALTQHILRILRDGHFRKSKG